jgi:hypothetical protein
VYVLVQTVRHHDYFLPANWEQHAPFREPHDGGELRADDRGVAASC